MPLIPEVGLLDRTLHFNAHTILEDLANTIDLAVNLHTHCLAQANNEMGLVGEMPVLLFARHVAVHGDAISQLIRNGITEAIVPLLRTMLESWLQLEYLLQADSSTRMTRYHVCRIYHEIATLERLEKLAQTRQGAESPEITAARRRGTERITFLKHALGKKEYQQAVLEYGVATKKRSHCKWYSLGNGPRNLQQLAESIGKGDEYEMFYRMWSSHQHGSDVTDGLIRLDEEKTAFRPYRFPREVEQYALLAVTFVAASYGVLIEKYGKEKSKELIDLHIGIVRPGQARMMDMKRVEVK